MSRFGFPLLLALRDDIFLVSECIGSLSCTGLGCVFYVLVMLMKQVFSQVCCLCFTHLFNPCCFFWYVFSSELGVAVLPLLFTRWEGSLSGSVWADSLVRTLCLCCRRVRSTRFTADGVSFYFAGEENWSVI